MFQARAPLPAPSIKGDSVITQLPPLGLQFLQRVTLHTARTSRRRLIPSSRWAFMAVCIVVVGCDQGQVEPASFEALTAVERTLELEETAAVINVEPMITLDQDGRLLVADRTEGYFRIYRDDGSLINQFGGRGGGEGEFMAPASLLPDRTGRLIALDFREKGAVYSTDGRRLERTLRTPFTSVYKAVLRDDGRLLVAGTIDNDAQLNRLHLGEIDSDSIHIIRSFMPTPVPPELLPAAINAGIVGMAVQGDTIAATFALSDSIYIFDGNGERLESVGIPITNFRPATAPPRGADRDRVREWVDSFTMVTELFWLPDGSFVAQYQDRTDMLPNWRFVRFDREGFSIGEVIDSPRILAGPTTAGHLLLQQPGHLTPNRLHEVSFQ